MLGGILLGGRPVLARIPDIRASCMCCLGSRTLNAYDDDDFIHEQFTVKAYPALFEGEGRERGKKIEKHFPEASA